MKKNYTYFVVLLCIVFASCSTSRNFSQDYQPQSSDISYQQFYDDLSPYGNWVNYRNYGAVWVPAEAGFRPYYNNGHWLYTNYGWTWVSNYNWGWAPFHYGRWMYDDAYGWMWMPGYEWAPAWVSWRSSGDYYGWAPLGPGMDFNMNGGSGLPYNYWSFVPHRYINNERVNNYCVNNQRNVTIINNTTVINNSTTINNRRVFTGPSQSEVERVTHEKIMPRRIVQRNTPGNTEISGSTVSIYKPSVREKEGQYQELNTDKVERLNEAKPSRTFDGRSNGSTSPANPANPQTQPYGRQKLNYPAANEKPDNVTEKHAPASETRRTFPSQKPQQNNDAENLNNQKNNNIRQQETIEQNNNKVPASRVIRQQEDQPANVAPVENRQPAREQKNTPPPQPIQQQNFSQENKLRETQPPVLRDQHPARVQESGQKESFRKKID